MRKGMGSFIIAGILFLCCVAGLSYSRYVESSNKIYLKASFPKNTYKLGEIVSMDIQITNKSSEVLYLSGEALETLKIQISRGNNDEYKNYYGNSRNFLVDGDYLVKIIPRETIHKQRTILWNFIPDVSGLNADAAKPVLEDRILTAYAFTKAGTYFVKAVLMMPEDGKSVKIESEPFQITIDAPVGEDLEVWNKIKDNGDIGFFLHEGDIVKGRYHESKKRETFLNGVQELINQYPDSFYAEPFRQSFVKYRANEARRQEFMKKMQKPQ